MRFLIIFFICISVNAQTRYVTATGAGSHDGTSEANAWTLAEAFTNAAAGMTINCKAGNYGALQLTLTTSGTQANPIIFRGYITTPGDIVAVSGTTFSEAGAVITSEGPSIVGTITSNRPNQDQGLRFTGQWIEFRNFQFQYYNRPFESIGDNCIIDNVYGYSAGNHNPTEVADNLFSATFPTGGYTGYGARIQGDNITVKNMTIIDAGAEGIRLTNSDNPTFENITVECVRGTGTYNNHYSADGNITDYHFLIGANTSNGSFDNITIINPVSAIYPGHGIVVKPLENQGATNHVIENFETTNTYIETQFPDTQNITFRDGVVNSTDNDSRREAHGARIANGSQDVIVQRVEFNGARWMSWGWDEAVYQTTYTKSAVRAKVLDCLFNNTNSTPYAAIAVSAVNFPAHQYTTEDLVIDHVTVYNYFYLFEVAKPNTNTDIFNIVVDGVTQEITTRGTSNTFDETYSTSNFSNGFSAPSGTAITSLQPQFANPGLGDFTLGNASLQGISIATPNFPANLDIGYIDNGSSGDVDPPIVSNETTTEITGVSFRRNWDLNEPGTRFLEWDTDSGAPYSFSSTESMGYYTSHFDYATGLNTGTLYYARVRGKDQAGNQYFGTEFQVTTTGTPPDPDPPAWQEGLKGRTILVKF